MSATALLRKYSCDGTRIKSSRDKNVPIPWIGLGLWGPDTRVSCHLLRTQEVG